MLLEGWRSRLKSVPRFQEADAVAHLASAPDASVDYVLTERFIQNMPSEQCRSM